MVYYIIVSKLLFQMNWSVKMIIPKLKIGNLIAKVPIVQGGMGVGISLSNLATAVANCGAIGVISAVEPGFNRSNYYKDKFKANIEGLTYHIQRSKKLAPHGILGVNIMTALSNFEDMVKVAVKEKIDIIFSGAGIPTKLPELIKGSLTKIAPIVSSGRVAHLICKQWDRKYSYLPDAMVIEGPEAGGHLGFSTNQLFNIKNFSLSTLIQEVLIAVKPFEEKYNRKIPIIAGGGIHDAHDMIPLFKAGACGIQMGTRFVATDECDASQEFKQAYIHAQKEDITIIQSPVGMPGRAIRNHFIEYHCKKEIIPTQNIHCIHCLKSCNPQKSPYCIADALINAQKGNLDKGFAFAGSKVHKINKILSVKELINELIEGLAKQ
jgi:nitronate monooxygenase